MVHIAGPIKGQRTALKRLLLLLALLTFLLAPQSGFAARGIEMNFNDVEVLSIVKLMSKATGRTFVFNAKELAGKKITVVSTERFSRDQALKIFEEVLSSNGLFMANEGSVTRIFADREAKGTLGPISDKPGENPGSFVTRIIQLKHASGQALKGVLTPLVSKGGTLTLVDPGNIIILKDQGSAVERFSQIVMTIDQSQGSENGWRPRLLPLKYAGAEEIAKVLSQIFGGGKGGNMQILADKRTNNLIIIGLPSAYQEVVKLVSQMDGKIDSEGGNIRVYNLKNAKAERVAQVLGQFTKELNQKKKQQRGRPTPTPPRKPGSPPTPGSPVSSGGNTNITVMADVPSNSLVVFADASDYATIENVIEQLDVVRPQVFIQALIMEIKLDKSLNLGVEWQASQLNNAGTESANVSTLGGPTSTGIPQTTDGVLGQTGSLLGVVGAPITFNGQEFSSFSAFIKATQNDQEIDILANPQILTLNNEEAEIKVGEVIPTIGSTKVDTNGNETTTIEYKEVGIVLKIEPQINADNSIELKIEEQSSNVVEGKSLADQGAITTLNRALSTTVVVNDGNTIALGGLISDEKTEVELKTPCLGDVPIFGWLFKTTQATTRKTNLMIFLTPRVVKSEEELAQVSRSARLRLKNARAGRFRVEVSKEYDMPDLRVDHEEYVPHSPRGMDLMRRD